MSDFTGQICDFCQAKNNTADANWARSLGVWAGAPTGSAATVPPGQRPQPNIVRPIKIDICAACKPGVTLAQLLDVTAKITARMNVVSQMIAQAAPAAKASPAAAAPPTVTGDKPAS